MDARCAPRRAWTSSVLAKSPTIPHTARIPLSALQTARQPYRSPGPGGGPAPALPPFLSMWLQLAPSQCRDGLGGALHRRAPRPSRRLDPLALAAVGGERGCQLLGDALALDAQGRLVVQRERTVVEVGGSDRAPAAVDHERLC